MANKRNFAAIYLELPRHSRSGHIASEINSLKRNHVHDVDEIEHSYTGFRTEHKMTEEQNEVTSIAKLYVLTETFTS